MTAPDAPVMNIPTLTSPRSSSLASSRSRSVLARYLAERGWVHLILLAAIGIFLFPFGYMVATSLKTDEELAAGNWLPTVPHFTPASPYVRAAPAIERPAEVTAAKWDRLLPQFRRLTRAVVDSAPAVNAAASSVDADRYHAAATDFVINRVVPRLNLDLWAGEEAKIVAAYQAALLPDFVAAALDDRLARLELRGLQARSLDAHIYSITPGGKTASTWTIESDNAHFIPTSDAAVLQYQFTSSSAAPIVLRCEFDYPGTDPKELHKLMLAVLPDDSWHQVDATLDLGGVHWVSGKTKYLGTTRRMSLLFQPPSFDDTTARRRIWVPMTNAGASPADADPRHGTLRVIIFPSSTVGAILGKVRHNYRRVFESVPFWTYIRNSLLVVVLATLGTLLSSSFVAYAFARLNWPGRGAAFAILLATIMLPAQVTMIPSFMIWRTLGLYNTLCPLWLPAWFGVAFFIFLMVQQMKTIPRELEEAARIDGAGPLRTWAQIIVPQTRPVLAAIAIMVFMASWNDFLGPLIYLRDQGKFPLSLGLYALRLDNPEGGIDWTLIMAGNVLMTLPVVVVFFLFQRYFIQGMTLSGMKG
jgi:ABC-type glycerol-3-phosphate transport system permease component